MEKLESLQLTPRLSRWGALLFVAAAMLRCGAGGTPLPPSSPVAVSTLDSTPAPLLLSPSNQQIAQGTAQQFTLRRLQPSGQVTELTSQGAWTVSSLDGQVLAKSATENGLVEIAQPGQYRVTVTHQGRTVGTTIFVTAATLKSIALSPTAPNVAKGLTQQFTATATFSDGTTQDVTALSSWSIKDTTGSGVASINSRGLAACKSIGKARITARYLTASATATLEVTAATLRTLTISPQDVTASKGTFQQFTATGLFSDGTVQDVTSSVDWAVMDLMGSGVTSIDGTGIALAESVGQAQVSAEYLGQISRTTFTVTAAAVVSLAISPTAVAIAKGTAQQFVATAHLADGSNQDVSAIAAWTSVDVMGSGVAAVDAAGAAKGNSVGTANIACAYKGFTATTTLTIKPAALVAIAITPATATLAKGLYQAFKLVGSYSDGTKQDVTTRAVWSAADVVGSDVASISAGGVALGKNVGQARLKAEHMGVTASATLTVNAAALTSLLLTPSGPAIAIGATVPFKALGAYTDGSTQDYSSAATWSITDVAPASGVATLGATGLATGKSKGVAVVTAAYLGISGQTTLSVGLPLGDCSVDGWCWRNPLPQGNYLSAVWASDASNVWAVSDLGVILKWSGSVWTTQPSGTTQNLLGLWGSDLNNVWAVGVGGTIVHWNGSVWTAQPSGTAQSLSAVWGTDASNVWAVGGGGVILKWNGIAWAAQPSGTGQYLRGIWGTDASSVWVIGASGTILKWNGSTFTTQASGSFQYLRCIWGTDASNVWAAGSGGTILKWDGRTWTAQESGSFQNLHGIWGTGASNLWAVGDFGTVLTWNGTAWSAPPGGTTQSLNSIWGTATNSIWAVGAGGVIVRWNGSTWAADGGGPLQSLSAVWGSDAKNLWFVGAAGTILKWDGTSFAPQASGTTQPLYGMWGRDASSIWAVGAGGTIVNWNGTAWSAQASGVIETLLAVWGSDASNLWAVGTSGTILHGSGGTWTAVPSGTINGLYGVWGTGANNSWAVGSVGTVMHWDGTAWTVGAIPTTQRLMAVWGSDASNVWAVGTFGIVVKWNGAAWAINDSGQTQTLYGIWGTDASHIWTAGAAGTLLKWDGSTWTAQRSGSTQALNGLWGTDSSNIWAAGNQGTVLQHGP